MTYMIRKGVFLPAAVAILIAAQLFVATPVVAEDSQRNRKPPPGIQGSPSTRLVPDSGASISNSRAARLVKQRYSSSRVLGVSLLEKGGAPIYRVRTLSADGVVKSVFVDGKSGEVFE